MTAIPPRWRAIASAYRQERPEHVEVPGAREEVVVGALGPRELAGDRGPEADERHPAAALPGDMPYVLGPDGAGERAIVRRGREGEPHQIGLVASSASGSHPPAVRPSRRAPRA